MQYLLSEEEMEVIRKERLANARMPSLEALVNVCQHVACTMIDTKPANGRMPKEHAHGCIHVDNIDPRWQTHYCDFCPVSGICPQPKSWSK